ncbi:Phenol hydroxylase, C-terminal dimerization domain [Rhizoctonia solani]|uniref:Phenol hydroxylase, C-terminal dimerization domain n=1 Tax=Rhizoctonia solani TaxID=456999 RepID=A0A8H7M8F0_9AGAM|nr:Phenol hydroxylase, C-terminal dimerization domain [Rhizoctonia solani]
MPAVESKVDVLIIGAGPAGLMCAHGLAKAGVNVRIIDKRPSKVAAGQADGIQPRTIEVLQLWARGPTAQGRKPDAHGCILQSCPDGSGIQRSDRLPDVTAPTARFPFEVTLHQGAIENIFRDAMRALGKPTAPNGACPREFEKRSDANDQFSWPPRSIEVEQPVVPTSISLSTDAAELASRDSYPVTVHLKKLSEAEAQRLSRPVAGAPPNSNEAAADGSNVQIEEEREEIVRAKYVVGCDGAHSWTRAQMGWKMEGEHTDYVWGVVDTIPDTDFPDIRNRTAIHSDNGSCMIVPREGDLVRLYVQLAEIELGGTGRMDRSKMTPEKIMDVAKRSFQPFRLEFPRLLTGGRSTSLDSVLPRTFRHRNASLLQAMLVGHTHSPKAGQGMNASMNDTHNLIWKLTQVLRGWASPDLLKTYELERRKYAQDLIEFDRKFSALFSGKAQSAANMDGVSHQQFVSVFQTFGGFTSGIGIHYAPSAIVETRHQSLASKLIIGQRLIPQTIIRTADARPFEIQDLIPSDIRYKLIVFAGNTKDVTQKARIQQFADELDKPERFYKKYTPAGAQVDTVFEIIVVRPPATTRTFPPLRTHWSKVFMDDEAVQSRLGGGRLYETYGIGPEGCVAVVRPDGYIGNVVPLDGVDELDSWFGGFMASA